MELADQVLKYQDHLGAIGNYRRQGATRHLSAGLLDIVAEIGKRNIETFLQGHGDAAPFVPDLRIAENVLHQGLQALKARSSPSTTHGGLYRPSFVLFFSS